MTPRQQRRLEQKLARKAAKKEFKSESEAPISDARLAANRANAQLSHGPVTESGKQIVSQNATRHGLTGRFQVMPGESQDDFDQMLAGYMRAEAPVDQDELELVKQMAQATWLSNRSTRLQDRCLITIQSGTPEEQQQARKDLGLYLRYMTSQDRAFSRYSAELRKRQNQRQKLERGFVLQKLREAAESRREAAKIWRQAQEDRKKEMHELRRAIANCRRERLETQNRIAEAREERAKTMAAAA